MSSAGPAIQLGYPGNGPQIGRRADIRPLEFDKLIEMHGYRLAWSRATDCPCAPLNTQTNQADPSCAICQGAGYLYFNTAAPQDPALVGELTTVQQKLIRPGQSAMIRGLMMGLGTAQQPFNRIGRIENGQASVTVRAENRLGYLDRLIAIDAYVVHTQRVELEAPYAALPLRYLVDGGVNVLASTERRFVPDDDFEVRDGQVFFAANRAPEPGTTLTVHYNCHPQYLIVQQPHAMRLSYVPSGNLAAANAGLSTPEGRVAQLPLQAAVQLDWLVGQDTTGVLA